MAKVPLKQKIQVSSQHKCVYLSFFIRIILKNSSEDWKKEKKGFSWFKNKKISFQNVLDQKELSYIKNYSRLSNMVVYLKVALGWKLK